MNNFYLASQPGRWRTSASVLALLCALSGSAQAEGYGHGTSAAVIASKSTIVAAIDSKEVDRQYLSDGTYVSENQTACKVRRTGPFYVMIAGISRATDGFNALQFAASLYRDNDTLDDFAARLMDHLPARLDPILAAIRTANPAAFDQAFSNQDVLQMSLLGAEQNTPRAIIVTFRADAAGGVAAHRTGKGTDAVYLLGMHDESDNFLRKHPEIAADTSTSRALQLIEIEYASHPEVVGGPATVVRVTASGAVIEQPGACTDYPVEDDALRHQVENNAKLHQAALPLLKAQLDDTIASVENVVVHEDVEQFWKHGGDVHTGEVHAVVRVVAGEEDYTWSNGRARMPTPWCGGELATMMRVTSHMLTEGQGTLSLDKSGATTSPETPGDPAILMTFHATELQRNWQLVVGGRVYPVAFEGKAWFSPDSGKLIRIRWDATDLHLPASTGITRIEWDETFAVSDIAGRPYLTPSTAVYRVSYSAKSDRTEWTETRFSDFRRFGATANVQFEQASLR